ncbi:MAG: hypothetical protein WAV90_07255 [Gordonia amarae]
MAAQELGVSHLVVVVLQWTIGGLFGVGSALLLLAGALMLADDVRVTLRVVKPMVVRGLVCWAVAVFCAACLGLALWGVVV